VGLGGLNDFGDIVFTMSMHFQFGNRHHFTDALFLRTTRPDFYQGDGFTPCRLEDAPRCGLTFIPPHPVPEPGTLALFGLGLAVVYRKRLATKWFQAGGSKARG
jgi:hypothetical protein